MYIINRRKMFAGGLGKEAELCTNRRKGKSWRRVDIGFVGIWEINGVIYLEATPVIGRLKFPILCTTSDSWLFCLRFEPRFQDSFKQTLFDLIKA